MPTHLHCHLLNAGPVLLLYPLQHLQLSSLHINLQQVHTPAASQAPCMCEGSSCRVGLANDSWAYYMPDRHMTRDASMPDSLLGSRHTLQPCTALEHTYLSWCSSMMLLTVAAGTVTVSAPLSMACKAAARRLVDAV